MTRVSPRIYNSCTKAPSIAERFAVTTIETLQADSRKYVKYRTDPSCRFQAKMSRRLLVAVITGRKRNIKWLTPFFSAPASRIVRRCGFLFYLSTSTSIFLLTIRDIVNFSPSTQRSAGHAAFESTSPTAAVSGPRCEGRIQVCRYTWRSLRTRPRPGPHSSAYGRTAPPLLTSLERVSGVRS